MSADKARNKDYRIEGPGLNPSSSWPPVGMGMQGRTGKPFSALDFLDDKNRLSQRVLIGQAESPSPMADLLS